MSNSIQKRDLCGYFVSGFCMIRKVPCQNVAVNDCPVTNELLELIRLK